MIPQIHVNGVALDRNDWILIGGGVLVATGLVLLGPAWALIGFGSLLIIASRLKWVSSTNSPSDPQAPPQTTATGASRAE